MPMVGLCVLPRVAIAKVDISLILGSHDEEEKKTTTTATTATTVSAASESSRESAAPEPLAMQSSCRQLSNIQEEPADTLTVTTPSVPAKRPATDAPAGQPSTKRPSTKWSAEEDALIIELRGQGMKWDHISKRLPGRSPISCRLHYQNYLERRSEWDEDKKNKLARLYERFKADMWSKIAEEMAIPWRAAEAMHWKIGEYEIARRAGVNPFYLTSPSAEQPRRPRPSCMQPARPRRETGGHPSAHGQLPSVAELTAGVPAYAPQQQLPHEYNHPRTRTRSQSAK